jgi:esterase/lipase superfamily enzyme
MRCAFLILVCAGCVGSRPPGAVEPSADPTSAVLETDQFVQVDVFYGTDRALTGSSDPRNFFGGDRGELSYGRVSVSIPRGHSLGELESPAWWRMEVSQDPAKHIILQAVTPLDREATFAQIRQTVDRSKSRSAFVFVHGYNVGFEEAARRTAQLAYDLDFDGVPLFYSWPSDADILGYTRDEADVAWTATHLHEYLTEVVARSGAEHINIIAHSMGNRAVTQALMRLSCEGSGPVFDQVLLTAPDIDTDIFMRDLAPVLPTLAKRVTLYSSSKDRALQASKKVHGYARAGDSGDGLVVIEGIDTVDASGIDTDLLGHGYYAESEPILKDFFALLRSGVLPGERDLLPKLKNLVTYWLLR